MPQLTRKWWKQDRRRSGDDDGGGGEDHTLDDLQPVDTEEQEEMVGEFEKAHAQHSRLWRSIFGGFLVGYVAFLMYSIFQQASYPWELHYHAYFMDEIHPWMVLFADWVAVLACLLAVKGLLQSSRPYRQWMWYSFYTGLLLTGFWLYYMMRLPRFRWDVIWLPFGPLSGAGVCLYVDRLLEESLEDTRKLRSSMYNFKAL